MSPNLTMIGSFVRENISPRLTSLYARLGLANRNQLSANLKGLDVSQPDKILDDLVSWNILKERFRKDVTSLDQVQPFMLKGGVDSTKVETFSCHLQDLFPGSEAVMSKLSEGVFRAGTSTGTTSPKNVALTIAFMAGAATAITIGAAIFGSPFTPALLGITTAGSIAVNKLFGHHHGAIGEIARVVSRKIAPIIYLLDAGFLGRLVFESNMNAVNISDAVGLEGTVGIVAGLVLMLKLFARKHVNEFEKSFPGQLDPGDKKHLRKSISTAAKSSAAEVNYITNRFLLFGAASAYLFMNTLAIAGGGALAMFAVPPLFMLGTIYARSRHHVTFNNEKQAKWWDKAKIYSPLWGLGIGAVGSLILGVARGVMYGGFETGIAPLVSFLTFYGSLITLFPSETHGAFHTLNTSLGYIKALKASSRDLMGKREMIDSTKNFYVLSFNPHTGIWEHTYGLLGSILLNRKPKRISYVCMFDQTPFQIVAFKIKGREGLDKLKLTDENSKKVLDKLFGPPKKNGDLILKKEWLEGNALENIENALWELVADGTLSMHQSDTLLGLMMPHLESHRQEKEFLAWVTSLQSKIFSRIVPGIDSATPLRERYGQLKKNLENVAEYFDRELAQEIKSKEDEKSKETGKERKWFDYREDIAEYRRAFFEELALLAEEFRNTAKKLECQLEKNKVEGGYISEKDLKGKWEDLLGCYDPDYIKKIRITRKLIAGDDLEVRKVENVATGPLQRALTLYKAWYKEPAERMHAEEWIYGTWTQVANPEFSYSAEPGEQNASKFIWIPTEYVLTDLQKENRKYLSNSKYIESVDNLPMLNEGFKAATNDIELFINGKTIKIQKEQCAFVDTQAKDQNIVPSIREIQYRDGSKENYVRAYGLPEGYKLVTKNAHIGDSPDVEPSVFTVPAFDFTLMQDKNDIQVSSYHLLPAILRRAKLDRFIHFITRRPIRGEYEVEMSLTSKQKRLAEENKLELDLSAGIEVIDANIELIYQGRFIPYKLARSSAHKGKDDFVKWQSMKAAKITMENGEIQDFSLVYGERDGVKGDFEVTLPRHEWPSNTALLELPEGSTTLQLNNFARTPLREGDSSWLMVTFKNGSIAFTRTPDGKRPRLFNKNLGAAPGQKLYYKAERIGNNRIKISDIHYPVGTTIFVARGWDREITEGMSIESLNPTGNVKLVPGIDRNLSGQMLGKAVRYDENGQPVDSQVVALGNYLGHNRMEHIQAAIEIVDKGNSGKLTVVERRMDTTGLPEDRSKYIYTLKHEAAKKIEQEIIDTQWIEDVKIVRDEETKDFKVIITFTPAGSDTKTLELTSKDFRDNDEQPLLANPKAGMAKLDDLYCQGTDSKGKTKDLYTDETRRFRPWIDEYNGNLRLIVHKVRRYEIDKPAGFPEINVAEGQSLKIFPSSADATVKVNGKWIPLTLEEPLKRIEIDFKLSQVLEGNIKSAIGPQTRFGESNNLSVDYPRDPYFYGFKKEVIGRFQTILKWGENFGINRAKAIRAFRGIQSGRTHVMDYTLLHNRFADIMKTVNEAYVKLSNFATEMGGPGVSEDTQMEMAYWLKGIKMWVVKEMIALMAAEKEWGRYYAQNPNRYALSEVLFQLGFLLSALDIFEARFLGKHRVQYSWAEMSEITAGRTWYKQAAAELPKDLSIGFYLNPITRGSILWYPVELVWFGAIWLHRTYHSTKNYLQHLWSLGYNFATGFWKNTAVELTMLRSYFRVAWEQFLTRAQYGTFATTAGGSGAGVPKDNKSFIQKLGAFTGISLVSTVGYLAIGGLAFWLVLPLGLAAIPTGMYFLARGQNSNKRWVKYALSAAGGALSVAGLGAAILGLPALGNLLSIAIIANFGFGMYNLGLMARTLIEIRRANKAEKLKGKYDEIQIPLASSDRTTLDGITKDIDEKRSQLTLAELIAKKRELKNILIKINIMNEKGKITQGVEHPYRVASHDVLDTYKIIEMTICLQAIRRLENDRTDKEAESALINLLKESREFVVVDTAAKLYRRLGEWKGDNKIYRSLPELAKDWSKKQLHRVTKKQAVARRANP